MSEEIDYRYPGSRPFEDTPVDRCLFFGREKEKQSLLHMVLTEKLVVLFAKSGIGKTSLINSGIMEQLREKGYLPFRITFTDPKIEPLKAVYERIDEIVKEYHMDNKPGEKATLWQYFKTAQFWSPNDILFIPILVLDQFEELFTLHSKERREKFVTQLADLVRNRIPIILLESMSSDEGFPYTDTPPAIKIVISVREDFLANLEEMSDEIPDILHKRFRLLPLDCGEARKAIEEPAKVKSEQIKTAAFQYTPDAIDSMIAFLSKKKERVRYGIVEEIKSERRFLRKGSAKIRTVTTNEVEPFELQLLCHDIEIKVQKREAKEGGDIIIQKDDLGGQKGMQKVLEKFYSDQIKKLRSLFVRKRVRNLFEKHLISDTDRRRSLDEEEIERKAKVPEAILQKLVKNRLLRSEPRLDSVYYELSHDTLIDPIRKSQRRRKLKRRLVKAGLLIIILIAFVFISSKISQTKRRYEAYYKANEYVLSARIYLEQGKLKEAHMQFEKAIEIDPYNVNIYTRFGNYCYNMKKYEDAITVYDKAIKMWPDDGSLRYLRGIALKAKGSLKEAFDEFNRAIQLEPGLGEVYIQLGTIYKERGNLDEAENKLKVALNYDNKNVDVYKELALLYIEQDRYDEVKDVYNKATEADPELAYMYTDLGKALEIRGQGAIADNIYEIASDVKSTKKYYYNLGDYLKWRGKNELAIKNYEKALEIDPEYTDAYNGLGDVFTNRKNYKEAMKYYEKALGIDPKYADTYKKLALLYIKQNQYDEVKDVYLKAIEADPELAYIYSFLGKALESKGQGAIADNIYEIASDVKSTKKYYYDLGYYLKGRGKSELAIKNYEKALEIDPEYTDAYNGLGDVFKKQEDYKEAMKYYKKAIEIDPKSAKIYNNLGYAYEMRKNYEEAIKYYEKAIEINPTYASVYNNLGNVFLNQKNYEEAMKYYKKAIEINPTYAYANNGIGCIFFEKGNYEEAIKYYKKAHIWYPSDATIESNLAEVSLITGRFEDGFELANKVLREENVLLNLKVAMKFVSSCSLLFLDKSKRSEAFDGLRDTVKEYKGLDKDYLSHWNYGGIEHFISETNKLSEADKKILLNVIRVIKLPRQEADEKLSELDASLSVIL